MLLAYWLRQVLIGWRGPYVSTEFRVPPHKLIAVAVTEEPRILATSDIHSPEYLKAFLDSLRSFKERPCLFLFAGDIIDRGNVAAAEPVFAAAREVVEGRMVATFGNDEFQDRWDELRRRYPDVDWLADELKVYTCGGVRVAVVGTPGAIDRPTSWQLRHIENITKIYAERVNRVAELLREARSQADYVILLSHYALARGNLKGEDPRIYPSLYSSRMERLIAEARPTVAVHGHAHNGTRLTQVNGVPVYNVAFPLNRSPVWVRRVRVGLDAFL